MDEITDMNSTVECCNLTPVEFQKYNVILSGCVLLPADEYVQFRVRGLQFRFRFITSTNNSGINAELKSENEKQYLSFELNESPDVSFSSLAIPANVGTIDGKKLLMMIASRAFPGEEKKLNHLFYYTWMLEK